MDKLREIIEHKWKSEVEMILPLSDKLHAAALARNEFRSLAAALRRDLPEASGLGLIAEVKKASPSAGTIAPDFDPLATARAYDAAGVSAISVLTDEKYFGGKLSHLVAVRSQVKVPCLRKDFIVHETQVWESSLAGADAILLIVAALDHDQLEHLLAVAEACHLEALVEVHNREEMDRALNTDAKIIGINNRNLHTFEVDLHTTETLSEEVPRDIILVSESGIKTPDDARMLERWGAEAVLVGETLMRADDVTAMVHALMGPRNQQVFHATGRTLGR